MRIVIDAKWYFSGHPSGKVVISNLLEKLVVDHPENKYVVILKSEDRKKMFPLNAPNVEVLYSPIGNNLLSNFFALPFLLRKQQYDVVVSQNFAIPWVSARQVTIVFDVIFRTHPHFFTLWERLYFFWIKPLLSFTDAVVTISNDARHDMETLRYSNRSRPCHVMELGVGDQFKSTASASIQTQGELIRNKYDLPKKYVLYVGRINVRKNVENLVRSIHHWDDSDSILLICGGANWKTPRIEELISSLGLQSRVYLLGVVPDADLRWLYRLATAFASVSYKEGFGLPPLEALANGLVPVLSRIPVHEEVCGNAAEYVDANDPVDIARGISKILIDSEYRHRLAALGAERVAWFSWDRSAQQLLNVLYGLR